MALSGSRQLQLETRAASVLRNLLLELTEDPDAIRDTVEAETNLRESIAAAYADQMEDQILLDGLNFTIAKLKERAERMEWRLEKRKAAIQKAMELGEIQKLQLPEAALSLRATPRKVEVTDMVVIPEQYWIPQNPTLDKSKLKEDLLADIAVPGCTLTNGGVTISIRQK